MVSGLSYTENMEKAYTKLEKEAEKVYGEIFKVKQKWLDVTFNCLKCGKLTILPCKIKWDKAFPVDFTSHGSPICKDCLENIQSKF